MRLEMLQRPAIERAPLAEIELGVERMELPHSRFMQVGAGCAGICRRRPKCPPARAGDGSWFPWPSKGNFGEEEIHAGAGHGSEQRVSLEVRGFARQGAVRHACGIMTSCVCPPTRSPGSIPASILPPARRSPPSARPDLPHRNAALLRRGFSVVVPHRPRRRGLPRHARDQQLHRGDAGQALCRELFPRRMVDADRRSRHARRSLCRRHRRSRHADPALAGRAARRA